MTIHLVTVGTTARTYLADPTGERDPIPALASTDGKPTDHQFLGVDEHDPKQAADLLGRLAHADPDTRDAAARAVEAANSTAWPASATAEATTLAAVTGHAAVGPDDLVVLIATDTVAGLLAAFWNTALLLRGDFARYSYLHEPPAAWDERRAQRLGERGRLLIARIPGLDLTSPDDAKHAMRHLGHLGRLILESVRPSETIVVQPSGGYKATIPFVLAIAEGLRSVRPVGDGEPPRVEACVVHEDSDPPRRIDLPLRRFKIAAVRGELAAFATSDSTPVKPKGDALEGYAYHQEGNGWRLTPFGEGFRALIGQDEPGT